MMLSSRRRAVSRPRSGSLVGSTVHPREPVRGAGKKSGGQSNEAPPSARFASRIAMLVAAIPCAIGGVTTAAPLFARAGLIDDEGPAIQLVTVEPIDRRERLRIIRH